MEVRRRTSGCIKNTQAAAATAAAATAYNYSSNRPRERKTDENIDGAHKLQTSDHLTVKMIGQQTIEAHGNADLDDSRSCSAEQMMMMTKTMMFKPGIEIWQKPIMNG